VDSTAPQVFAGFAASYSSKILELKTEIESLTIPVYDLWENNRRVKMGKDL